MLLYDRMPAHRADSIPAGLLGTETTGKIGVAAGRNVPPANGQPLFGRQAQEGEREHPPVGNDPPFSPPTALAGNTYRLSSGAGTPGAAVPSRRTACGETSPEPSGKRRTTVRETRQKNSRPRPPYGNGRPGSLPSSGESRDSAGSAGISVRRQGRTSVLRGRSCRPGG